MTKLERIIITWPPIAFIIRKSKVIVLPGFQGIPLFDVVLFFFKQMNTVGINERAAAIAFNLIMALPATMLFLFSILPYFPDFLKIREEFLLLFKDISPTSNTYHFIEHLLDDLMQRNVGVFSFGFILIMFYASNAMMALIRTFDKSIQEKKHFFLHQRWRALQMTGILVLLIISTTLILIGQEQIISVLRKFFHLKKRAVAPWVNFLRWSVVVALFYYGIALIYKYAPSVKKRWRLSSPGTLLATTLTIVTTEIFSFWVSNFASYNRVYGSIGTVLILMLLIYINALILLIGFELNVSITYLVRNAEARNKA
ncbi:MAG: YihY/virulence factor BrkB family protein [Sediminibacterium sp.]|nr:YihY/virulence factor BrkB family protein [Chitinophagaceae bacterium]MCA6446028.1 YihY/virulence factor BrkB family protein [Chitinophagaceae bacterium]